MPADLQGQRRQPDIGYDRPLRHQTWRVAERRPAVSLAGRSLPPRDTPRRSRRAPRRSACPGKQEIREARTRSSRRPRVVCWRSASRFAGTALTARDRGGTARYGTRRGGWRSGVRRCPSPVAVCRRGTPRAAPVEPLGEALATGSEGCVGRPSRLHDPQSEVGGEGVEVAVFVEELQVFAQAEGGDPAVDRLADRDSLAA